MRELLGQRSQNLHSELRLIPYFSEIEQMDSSRHRVNGNRSKIEHAGQGTHQDRRAQNPRQWAQFLSSVTLHVCTPRHDQVRRIQTERPSLCRRGQTNCPELHVRASWLLSQASECSGQPDAAAVFSHEIASGELLAGKNSDSTKRRERNVNQAIQKSSSMLVCVAKFAGPSEVRESLELEKRLEIVAQPINSIPTAHWLRRRVGFSVFLFLGCRRRSILTVNELGRFAWSLIFRLGSGSCRNKFEEGLQAL
jgi:hypothetical protein